MPEIKQRSIEQFFQEYGISDPDQKARILPDVTTIIYDRNMLVAHYEKEENEYRKKQILTDLGELDQKIGEIFGDFLKK